MSYRRILTVFIAMTVVFWPSAANAHYVYQGPNRVWATDWHECVDVRSEISHSGNGYSKVDTHPRYAEAFPCQIPAPWDVDVGSVWNLHEGWFDPATGNWGVCASAGWFTNAVETSKYVTAANNHVQCNAGNYATWGLGYWTINGWSGGGVWSGSHWFE